MSVEGIFDNSVYPDGEAFYHYTDDYYFYTYGDSYDLGPLPPIAAGSAVGFGGLANVVEAQSQVAPRSFGGRNEFQANSFGTCVWCVMCVQV